MGTFSRLRYVIAANVNALIEKAEDPEKLLRALIREMEDASEEARMACAELLAEQHQRVLAGWLGPLGVTMAHLSGQTKGKRRKEIVAQLAEGELALVLGGGGKLKSKGVSRWAGARACIRSSSFSRLWACRALVALARKRSTNDCICAISRCCFS